MQFYIVNGADRPNEKHVAQIVNKKGELEYIHSDLRNWCRDNKCQLRLSETGASLFDFGFDVTIEERSAFFKKTRESTAVYLDKKIRPWQGENNFILTIKP